MNLLNDTWIPVQQHGVMEKITLQQLLCGEKEGELCLPRDDMEMAGLQLLCSITQVLFVPENNERLKEFIRNPISQKVYQTAILGKESWFDLAHPETPFMQFREVIPSQSEPLTSMDKLLAGVADGANKVFVNPLGLGYGLCSSCTAIALFNMANNAPSVEGGFLGSFRGNTPLTIMISGRNVRESVWLNVLSQEIISKIIPNYDSAGSDEPNYVNKIPKKSEVNLANVGLVRGLFWQPAHYELCPIDRDDNCSCCGVEEPLYRHFKKEKFKYSVNGQFRHPLSPVRYDIRNENSKKIRLNYKFDSFTTSSPVWTKLNRFLYQKDTEHEGHEEAPVVRQAKMILRNDRLRLIVGGYQYKPPQTATIIHRNHEFIDVASGWPEAFQLINEIINIGLGYKSALRKSLFSFMSNAIINASSKKNKDRIGGICSEFDGHFFRRSEALIYSAIASFDSLGQEGIQSELHLSLYKIVIELFAQATDPYQQEPKMLKALALARRSLNKSLKELKPMDRGGISESV